MDNSRRQFVKGVATIGVAATAFGAATGSAAAASAEDASRNIAIFPDDGTTCSAALQVGGDDMGPDDVERKRIDDVDSITVEEFIGPISRLHGDGDFNATLETYDTTYYDENQINYPFMTNVYGTGSYEITYEKDGSTETVSGTIDEEFDRGIVPNDAIITRVECTDVGDTILFH